MKRVILASLLAASIVSVPMVLADDETAPDSSHHFVKDSVITTKVKIKVDTDENGVVWLSGRAPTKDAADLAEMIAKNTDGVSAVHNDVVVQP
jgi:osmotically-inducible protein OsmY